MTENEQQLTQGEAEQMADVLIQQWKEDGELEGWDSTQFDEMRKDLLGNLQGKLLYIPTGAVLTKRFRTDSVHPLDEMLVTIDEISVCDVRETCIKVKYPGDARTSLFKRDTGVNLFGVNFGWLVALEGKGPFRRLIDQLFPE